jgi:hypothetical protein
MKTALYPFFILILVASVYGQISVETITTDTLNPFSGDQVQTNQRSSKAAMALSLLVPGLGHQYTSRPSSALAYLTFDVLSLAGAIFFERYSRQLESQAYGYAALYADVDAGIRNKQFWQMVAAYNSSSEYNNDVLLARKQDEMYYNKENYSWKWASDDLRKGFNNRQNDSRKFHIASAFCIGVMVLDRVIAFVDVRAATRYSLTSVHTSFSIDPVSSSTSILLSGEF